MQANGINAENIVIQEQTGPHVYTKPYIADVEQNRLDFGNFNELSKKLRPVDRLLESAISGVDAVIINQQVLSGSILRISRTKVEVIQRFPEKIFIADSRHTAIHTTVHTGK